MQLLNSLEKVLVFFNWVRKRIVTTGGMLERRRVLIVENPVIDSLSLYQSIRFIGLSLPTSLSSYSSIRHLHVLSSSHLLYCYHLLQFLRQEPMLLPAQHPHWIRPPMEPGRAFPV